MIPKSPTKDSLLLLKLPQVTLIWTIISALSLPWQKNKAQLSWGLLAPLWLQWLHQKWKRISGTILISSRTSVWVTALRRLMLENINLCVIKDSINPLSSFLLFSNVRPERPTIWTLKLTIPRSKGSIRQTTAESTSPAWLREKWKLRISISFHSTLTSLTIRQETPKQNATSDTISFILIDFISIKSFNAYEDYSSIMKIELSTTTLQR